MGRRGGKYGLREGKGVWGEEGRGWGRKGELVWGSGSGEGKEWCGGRELMIGGDEEGGRGGGGAGCQPCAHPRRSRLDEPRNVFVTQ